MADEVEERVDVEIQLIGKNNSGFYSQTTLIKKNVKKENFTAIELMGAEALVGLSKALAPK